MTEQDVKYIGTKEQFNKVLNSLQLTDRQYLIFILKYGRAMPQEDIASEIGCNRKTISEELKIIRHKIGQLDI